MSFDDNYFCLDTYPTHLEPAIDPEDWHTFLENLKPEDLDFRQIERTIRDNSAWLQSRPRQATEIITTLFPGKTRRVKELSVMIPFIGGYLLDAGYTPLYNDPNDPTWYWLEGSALPSQDI